MTFHEFWSAYYAKYPPELQEEATEDSAEFDQPFFSNKEQEEFAAIKRMRKKANV